MNNKYISESDILKSKISPWVSDYSKGSSIRTHSHSELQILYVSYGEMQVNSDAMICCVNPGQVAVISPEVDHEIMVVKKSEMASIYIGGLGFEHKSKCGLTMLPVSPMLKQLIMRTAVLSQDRDFNPQENIYLLGMLFSEIKFASNELGVADLPDDKRARSICKKVLNDPLKKVTLEAFSEHAGASPRTINRIFQRHYGMTFEQWRKKVKLGWAENKIQAGLSVSEVALELGYSTTSSFSYAFKKSTGRTPTSLLSLTDVGIGNQ